jgi:arylsulfatase A-like enzyme
MSQQISRREFLKLASLLPLVSTKWTTYLDNAGRALHTDVSPNILILVFDALSAFNSSLYGYNRDTTPNLSRFAERATVYNNHYAAGNFTSSGTASLLTGTYPWTHRALQLHGTVDENLVRHNIFNLFGGQGYTRVAYSHNYLAASLFHQFREDLEIFKKTRELCLVDDQFADRLFPEDFNVAFWSEWLSLRGNDTEPGSLFISLIHRFLRSTHKQDQLRQYGKMFPRGIPGLHNMLFVLEDAIDWLAEQLVSLHQPYLIYYHVLPPHEPYTTRRDFVDIFKDGWKPTEKPVRFFSEDHSQGVLNKNRREYDEYLAYADAEFGRLLSFMEQNGVLDNTYVIFTSDHGELFERGILGHVTQALYQPVIKVPLVILSPGQKEREEVYSPTSCVDLIPTLLHLNDQPIPDWCEGSVMPPFNQNGPQNTVFSVEAKSNPKYAPLNKATFSVIRNEYKLIHYKGYGDNVPEFELFDIANDPQESQDLSKARKSINAELADLLNTKIEAVNKNYL